MSTNETQATSSHIVANASLPVTTSHTNGKQQSAKAQDSSQSNIASFLGGMGAATANFNELLAILAKTQNSAIDTQQAMLDGQMKANQAAADACVNVAQSNANLELVNAFTSFVGALGSAAKLVNSAQGAKAFNDPKMNELDLHADSLNGLNLNMSKTAHIASQDQMGEVENQQNPKDLLKAISNKAAIDPEFAKQLKEDTEFNATFKLENGEIKVGAEGLKLHEIYSSVEDEDRHQFASTIRATAESKKGECASNRNKIQNKIQTKGEIIDVLNGALNGFLGAGKSTLTTAVGQAEKLKSLISSQAQSFSQYLSTANQSKDTVAEDLRSAAQQYANMFRG